MKEYVPVKNSTYALTIFKHKAEIDGKKVYEYQWHHNNVASNRDRTYCIDRRRFLRYSRSRALRYYASLVLFSSAGMCNGEHIIPINFSLVFDVTRKITYKNLMQWHKELKEHRPDIPVIVVANKIDENMKATSKKFKFATERGFKLFYCSAADGTNVVKVFKEAIRLAVENSQKPSDDFTEEVMRTIEKKQKLTKRNPKMFLIKKRRRLEESRMARSRPPMPPHHTVWDNGRTKKCYD
ncbi:hypothetical protein AAMO2058_001616700 [Amorphochlora amoebiformis]